MRPQLFDFPPDKERRFRALLKATSTISPTWLHTFNVRYVAADPGNNGLMRIGVDVEYRQACLNVFRTFWDCDGGDEALAHRVAHERFHLFVEPLVEVALDILTSAYPEKGPFRDLAEQRLTKALETVVEDLAVWWTVNYQPKFRGPK